MQSRETAQLGEKRASFVWSRKSFARTITMKTVVIVVVVVGVSVTATVIAIGIIILASPEITEVANS